MLENRPADGPDSTPWTPANDDALYKEMLQVALEETRRVVQLSGESGLEKGELVLQTWAAGFIRIGEM